jgi:5-oxoprolinase (ATP-hydrolysing) subunit A
VTIDLTFDGGEGCDDAALMPFVTSVNVACGGHTGDAASMRAAVRLAKAHGAAVNAHPSTSDRASFGRAPQDLAPAAVIRFVELQVGALLVVLRAEGVPLAGIKPHGALYHASSLNPGIARALLDGVRTAAGDEAGALVFVSSPGSALLEAAREQRYRGATEGFADRAYEADGSLVARTEPDALLTDPRAAANQAVAIARGEGVVARGGSRLALAVDTICFHGDTPGAPAIAAAVRRALDEAGIVVAPLSIL